MRKNMKMKDAVSCCLLIGLCLLFSSSVAFAVAGESVYRRHTFELGTGITYLEYEERGSSFDIKIDGPLCEMVGSYTYHNGLMIHGGLEYGFGDLNYDGVIQTIVTNYTNYEAIIGTPARTETEDWKLECRALIGYDHMLGGDRVVTPFFGIGYRYWSNFLKGGAGYERETEYWYSPIGVKIYGPLSANWMWGMSLEYDLFWEGTAGVDAPGFPDLGQDSGRGVGFSLQFNRRFGANYALSIEPFMTYWNIDKSQTETYEAQFPSQKLTINVHEPANRTMAYGLRIGLEF